MPIGATIFDRDLKDILCAFCFSPAWWLWRSVYTRSHLELGRKSLQRQWYFVLRRGRVGRCQACERQRKARPAKHAVGLDPRVHENRIRRATGKSSSFTTLPKKPACRKVC